MLERYLVQEGKLITPTRNKYGDYEDESSEVVACRFRYITTLRRATHQEIRDADAMVWFAPDTTVSIGQPFYFEGVYFQIERINKARRLGGSDVQFIKCDLKITKNEIS